MSCFSAILRNLGEFVLNLTINYLTVSVLPELIANQLGNVFVHNGTSETPNSKHIAIQEETPEFPQKSTTPDKIQECSKLTLNGRQHDAG